MQQAHARPDTGCCCRREFLQTFGAATGALTLLAARGAAAAATGDATLVKKTPMIQGAFIYPPSATLEKEGYWSWPGSSFEPEKQQREYATRIAGIARASRVEAVLESEPLDTAGSVEGFIARVQQTQPDAVLLVLFKKLHFDRVRQVLDVVQVPAIVVAPIGVLLADYVRQLEDKPKTYLINSMDVFDPLSGAFQAIAAARRLRDSLLVSIQGTETREATEKHLGTRVRQIPHRRFVEVYQQVEVDDEVRRLAESYRAGAMEIVEPTPADITNAARASVALKRIVEAEQADALMMDCLPGLRHPHQHVPPCMGFMNLHDRGIVAGCQADLEATLTMMLVRQLVDRPAFMNNPCLDTERNHYFGAHCTSPSKMAGFDAPPEPYILRSHCEAGWGCVPQVLFPEGQEVTMVHYFSGESPRMSLYTGQVVRCYPKLAAGCRTNVEITVRELKDIRDLVYGGHQIICYGNEAKKIRLFCQLAGIEVIG